MKSVVSQMSAHEVYDVVSNMKQMVEKEPDKAKQMFVSHPQVRTRYAFLALDLRCRISIDTPWLQRNCESAHIAGIASRARFSIDAELDVWGYFSLQQLHRGTHFLSCRVDATFSFALLVTGC